MIIEYYQKDIYGNMFNYVKDPVLAQYVAYITGKRTVSDGCIKVFVKLGIQFKESMPPKD